jgi:hypothetical protein
MLTDHKPTGDDPPYSDGDIRAGLRTIREGYFATQQTMHFCRIMFDAAMRDFITTREAGYYLTDKGRAFINGGEWSNAT